MQGMPQMALVHLTMEGTVKVVDEKFDLRRVFVAVNYADVRDVHLLRRAVTQVTIDKAGRKPRLQTAETLRVITCCWKRHVLSCFTILTNITTHRALSCYVLTDVPTSSFQRPMCTILH
ncbi:uncharacterized protein [Haliotis asinina]|uniref:uncharacterized protein n=1 Tax=Haliotis asinina TaxID=109174 RepID=UPI0035325614